MVVKDIFDPAVQQELINRINQLKPDSKPIWGKMNVAQMLSHLQKPIGVADGSFPLKPNWMGRLIGPLFKSKLYDDKPYKRGLPTAPEFITSNTTFEFEVEKNKLIGMITNFSESRIVNDRHPFFGKITKPNWSKALWKHLDHHLQQFGV